MTILSGSNKKNINIINVRYKLCFICITENIFGNFLEKGQYIARGHLQEDILASSKNTYNMVMVDITTTFTILIGIFFPSVTGQYLFYSNLF